MTAISSNEPGLFAIRSDGGGLTVNATNVIAFSESDSDVAHIAGFTPTAINLDHSNYDSESDPGSVITNPGTGFNQTAVPVFVDPAGDFHQQLTSAGTIDLGTTSGQQMGELDFEGQERAIGQPDIGADELGHQTSISIACIPAALTLGAGSTACTATVSDTVGALLPTGDVAFGSSGTGNLSGGGACTLAFVSDPVASCQLTCTPAAVGSGSHEITGSYPGDAAHEGSRDRPRSGWRRREDPVRSRGPHHLPPTSRPRSKSAKRSSPRARSGRSASARQEARSGLTDC